MGNNIVMILLMIIGGSAGILLNLLPYKNNDRKIPENLTVVVFRFILLLFFLPVQVLSVLPEWR